MCTTGDGVVKAWRLADVRQAKIGDTLLWSNGG